MDWLFFNKIIKSYELFDFIWVASGKWITPQLDTF